MNRILCLALLLCGCAAAPVRKPVPLPPPLPPAPTRTTTVKRIVALPPMPTGLAIPTTGAPFRPAAVEPPSDPLVGIYPFGVGYYLVVARQTAGCTLEMQWADTLGGQWNFLAGYGYTAQEQYVTAAIPSDWMPYHRMFVRASNTPQGPPSAFASIKGAPETYTTHKLNIKGVVYRLVEITPPGVQFRMYKLVK